MCYHLKLITEFTNFDVFAEVLSAAIDLDTIMEELGECGQVEYFVLDWLRSIDHILQLSAPNVVGLMAVGDYLLRHSLSLLRSAFEAVSMRTMFLGASAYCSQGQRGGLRGGDSKAARTGAATILNEWVG